jgi:phosphate acetyltransferase
VSRTVPNNLHTLVPGAILITAADRNDIIVAAGLAALSHLPIAGVILTGDMPIDERIVEFCRPALEQDCRCSESKRTVTIQRRSFSN